jgi:hypothetical protein
MCNAELQSDPAVDSQWRCLEANGIPFYVCPLHLPADGSPSWKFTKVYKRVLRRVQELLRQRPRYQ